MIIGFNAAAGAGFGAPGRIGGGQPGFSDSATPAGAAPGFSGALAQAAVPAASAPSRQGPQDEGTTVDTAAVDTATVDTAAVDAAAIDAPAANAKAVDGTTADRAAAVPAHGTIAGAAQADDVAALAESTAPPVTPVATDSAAQRAATGADLAAAMARAAVAPPASQSGVRPIANAGDNSAAGATTANGGALALPETLRPQAPAQVVRTTDTAPLPVATSDPAATLPAPAAIRAGQSTMAEWSPVKVDSAQAHWGRDLMAALAERVEMQVTQQIKQARIRLDPPELGRLQLTVRLDNDRLSVQLNASQPQVREMLALQLDRLRTDLVGQYGERVDVSVGQEQRQQRQPGSEPERQDYDIAAGLDALEPVEQTDTAAPRGQGWVNALA